MREDREELGPLEQRPLGVLGEREHPGVEVEPGQLAVQQPVFLGGVAGRFHGAHRTGEVGRVTGAHRPAVRRARDPPGEADRVGPDSRGESRIAGRGPGTLAASTRRLRRYAVDMDATDRVDPNGG